MIYSVIGINKNGGIIPLYFGLNEDAAKEQLAFYLDRLSENELSNAVLLKQV